MAQWTNIPTDRIEPGKPIRAIDDLALRDNTIAIAEGASGAPRVQTNGIANSAVTTSKIANSNVTTAKIANSNVTAQKLATGGNENNWVRARTATSTAGAVGTYAFVTRYGGMSGFPTNWNGTIAGSSLRPASLYWDMMTYDSNTPLSGTWRIMGYQVRPHSRGGGSNADTATLALRIS